MCTNGSGTNSVKPPLRRCCSRSAIRWRAHERGPSTWPNMIVVVERRPRRCAVSWTESHCSVVTLSGQMTARTSSSRISAAVPGSDARPASRRRARYVSSSSPRVAAQVFGELPFRERAEAAAEVADVGVVDVAGDDIGDLVSADLAPEPVGGREHAVGLLPARGEEPDDLVLAELLTGVDRERVPRDERDRRTGARGPAVFAGEPVAVGPTQSGR